MEPSSFVESVYRELEGCDVSIEQARTSVRCTQQYLSTTTRGSANISASAISKFCSLVKNASDDSSVPAKWAALSVLTMIVRAHAADEALASKLGQVLDMLLSILRNAGTQNPSVASTAILLFAAVVERCAVSAPDTRRDILQSAQKHSATLLQLLNAATSKSMDPATRRTIVEAIAVTLGILARTAPSLVKASAQRYIELLSVFLDADVHLSRASGRAIGSLAASMPLSASQQFLPAVFRAIVSVTRAFIASDEDEEGVTQQQQGQQDSENKSGTFSVCLAPRDPKNARADSLCNRVIGLCESVAAFLSMPAPGWRSGGTSQNQMFPVPTELCITAVVALSQLTPVALAEASVCVARPIHHVIACLPRLHICGLQLISIAVVVHGSSLLPLITSLINVLLQELWLAYRSPKPIADSAFRAELFRTVARCFRVLGSSSSLTVAARVWPFVAAELSTVVGDVSSTETTGSASSASVVAQSNRAKDATQRLKDAYGQAQQKRRRIATGSAASAAVDAIAPWSKTSLTAALECLEAMLACTPVELLAVGQQTEIASVLKSLLYADSHILSDGIRSIVDRCASLCATSASWTLAQLLPPLVECRRQSVVSVACCDALLCPRRAPLVVCATTADVAYRKQAAAERAAAMEHDVVAERRAVMKKQRMDKDDEEEEDEEETLSRNTSKPPQTVDMSTLINDEESDEKQPVAQDDDHNNEETGDKEKEVIEEHPIIAKETKRQKETHQDDEDDLMIDINAEPDDEDLEDDDE